MEEGYDGNRGVWLTARMSDLSVSLSPGPASVIGTRKEATAWISSTSGSWLNMVEIFFGILRRRAIRRGTFHSVHDLETVVRTYIDGWNQRAHPFTRTKTAEQIITHSKPATDRKKTYDPRH